jgi:hypothetical protein
MERTCTLCHRTKPVEDFYKASRGEGRVQIYSRCKECWRPIMRKRMADHRAAKKLLPAST